MISFTFTAIGATAVQADKAEWVLVSLKDRLNKTDQFAKHSAQSRGIAAFMFPHMLQS